MNYGILSLLPPILIIIMVILTKRVVPSLVVGIIVGCLIIGDFSIFPVIKSLKETFLSVFIDGNSLNTGNLSILLFILLLGFLTGFIKILGGNIAFAEYFHKKIKSARAAQLSTATLGLTLFPDDVFNMFTVGQISQPIFDRFGIARQKLAYIIHTVSDSLCVLFPISSWGAYIISILAIIFAQQGYDTNSLSAFIAIAPFNFYAITGLVFIFSIIYFQVDYKNMKRFTNTSYEQTNIIEKKHTSVLDLLLPIITLLIVVMVSIIMTGLSNSKENSVLSVFENANISLSLIIGTSTSILVTLVLFYKKVFKAKTLPLSSIKEAFKIAYHSSWPCIIILLFAWMVSYNTGELQTGDYLANFISEINFPNEWLLIVIFVFTGIMAFSTGTSWGTFAIMLPITANIALSMDEALLFPTLAAVLAGSLFGDHCSPISDTTTVAAAASGCKQFDHFSTQWPYALTVASIAAIGYLLYGFTSSLLLSYLIIAICITCVIVILKKRAFDFTK